MVFRFSNRWFSHVSCFSSSLGPIQGRNNMILSCSVMTRIKKPCNRVSHGWFQTFLREFRMLPCISRTKQPSSNGEWNSVQSKEERVGENVHDSLNKSIETKGSSENFTLEGVHDGITPRRGFLGIEVFPENFDKLPPKCSGCGAILQSSFENKPGFIPKNRNPTLSENNEENSFRSEVICSRCFSLKHYNKDVLPVVAPETITNFLTHISRRKALILYVIDVMDIPGSFVPDILNLVGETKHMVLVCNKVDRLAVDGHPHQQMERIKRITSNEAIKYGLMDANVRDVCVVSSKTGFGINRLVKTINKHWRKNSDIYLVGSNNSGKTTLFNLLVDLFAASRHSDDMLQRGTVGPSPGTTLSLLRYPITYHRFQRLQERLCHGYSEEKHKEKVEEVDLDKDIVAEETTKFTILNTQMTKGRGSTVPSIFRPQLVSEDKENPLRWLYDTPGVYSKNQITHLLTNKELKLLNPAMWFVPRTLILKPGKVLFIGGLARVDYLNVQRISRAVPGEKEEVPKASQSVFFTVFASPNLPIHVTSLERADMVYEKHAGNDLLKVPCGGKERMEKFPALSGRVMEITGVNWEQSAADIILSNVGWIALTAGTGSIVSVKVHTPGGVGLLLRDPPLMPKSVRQRGRRGMPYMGHVNHAMYQGTRKRSPSLVKILEDEDMAVAQWIKVAERKRKQQRLLLKFQKTKWHSLKKIGFSARSNPARYLADYEDIQEIEDEGSESDGGKLGVDSFQRLE